VEGDVGGQPLTSQRACAKNLVFAEGIEGGDGDGGNGNGVADGIEDLDGVPLCAVRGDVVVHQLDDVAATETMLRDIAREHCILVEFQLHHVLRLSGIGVTNFVTPDKCSVIQMVGSFAAIVLSTTPVDS
jgi:hypothetical protein